MGHAKRHVRTMLVIAAGVTLFLAATPLVYVWAAAHGGGDVQYS